MPTQPETLLCSKTEQSNMDPIQEPSSRPNFIEIDLLNLTKFDLARASKKKQWVIAEFC